MRRTVEVDNGDICARNNQGLGHDQTQTSGTTSDQGSLALKGEGGKGSLEMETSTALDRLLLRHSLLIERNLDGVVGSREGANVLTLLLGDGLLVLAQERCDRHVSSRHGKRAGGSHGTSGLAEDTSAEHDGKS